MSIEKMLFKKRSIKTIRLITIINIILILVNLFTYEKFDFVIGVLFFNLIINIHSCILFNKENGKNR